MRACCSKTSQQVRRELTLTTHSTSTTFNQLVDIHHTKSHHTRQFTILQKHIKNHTAPKGLTINMQPWVQLSPKHQEEWDTGLRDCMSHLKSIQHHTEQLQRVEAKISSLLTTINTQYSKDVSTTILNIATSHKPPPK